MSGSFGFLMMFPSTFNTSGSSEAQSLSIVRFKSLYLMKSWFPWEKLYYYDSVKSWVVFSMFIQVLCNFLFY
jgi:hypothetical protein